MAVHGAQISPHLKLETKENVRNHSKTRKRKKQTTTVNREDERTNNICKTDAKVATNEAKNLTREKSHACEAATLHHRQR